MTLTETTLYQASFESISKRQLRLVITLMASFLIYYALLLFGAAYFTKIFAIRITGSINVGIVFTVSQYFMAGVIAWIYVKKMQTIDAELTNLKA